MTVNENGMEELAEFVVKVDSVDPCFLSSVTVVRHSEVAWMSMLFSSVGFLAGSVVLRATGFSFRSLLEVTGVDRGRRYARQFSCLPASVNPSLSMLAMGLSGCKLGKLIIQFSSYMSWAAN